MLQNISDITSEYVIRKALENGVTIIRLTRRQGHQVPPLGKSCKGEIMIAQFTEHTSANTKIRGRVEVLTKHGRLRTDE